MNKKLIVLGLLVSSTAVASPKTESLGLGFGSTVGGTSGVVVDKHFSEDFGLQIAGGFSAIGGATGMGLGVYGVKPLISEDRGGASLVFGLDSRIASGGNSTGVDLGLGVGLQGDVFLTPGLSIWAQSGISAWMISQRSTESLFGFGGAEGAGGFALRIGPRGILGSVGFTWWIGQ